MPNQMVIDIDGVACAHAEAICEQVNKDFDLASSVEDVTTWDHDFGPITFVKAVEQYYPRSSFILSMQPLSGFSTFLDMTREHFDISFATARVHSQEATQQWLIEHFDGSFELSFVKEKVQLSPDILIDDCPGEIMKVVGAGGLGFLLKRPWNDHGQQLQDLLICKGAFAVVDFEELLIQLKGMGLVPE